MIFRTQFVRAICVLGVLLGVLVAPGGAHATAFDDPSFASTSPSWATNFGIYQQDKKVTVLSADVTGDGMADAIRVVNGTWYVAPSTGTGFAPQATPWVTGLGVPASGSGHINSYLAADVTGDGVADAIAAIDGAWYIGKSTRSGFTKYASPWATNFGIWSEQSVPNLLAADVNKDGMADAIRVVNGVWSVATSTGSGFAVQPTPWSTGPGVPPANSSHPLSYFAADVTGDGRADAVSVFEGTWNVGRSTGAGFALDPIPWLTNFGSWDKPVLLGDVNFDGRPDAIKAIDGAWSVAASSGNGFSAQATPWATGLGVPVGGTGHINSYFATDVTGDGKADAVAAADGSWSVGAAQLVRDKVLAPGSGYTLKFADEFDRTTLNDPITTKWNDQRDDYLNFPYHTVGGEPYNWLEAADYRSANVSVGNGVLSETIQNQSTGRPYSTGMVNTKGHYSFKYGYLEARVKVPRCSGCWGAFWMLPDTDAWPPEIDVFEYGLPSATNLPTFGSHWPANNPDHQLFLSTPAATGDLTSEWQDFALLWTPDYVKVFVNGMSGPKYSLADAVPKQNMYFILSQQVCTRNGSPYISAGADTSWCPVQGPQGGESMKVEYVHVYEPQQ